MQYVLDSLNPKNKKKKFDHLFWLYADKADHIDIAVGYIDVGSIAMMLDAMRADFGFSLNLFIGMQYHDGFTGPQILALENLADFLRESNRGQIFVSKTSRFHGKVYAFFQGGQPTHVYLGSGNLSAIGNAARPNLEAGVLLDAELKEVTDYLTNQVFPLGDPLQVGELKPTLPAPSPLEFIRDVDDLGSGSPTELDRFTPTYAFELPLKCTGKSNLNASYGRPRVHSASGRAIPRPWYEVELIPGTAITKQEGFPKREEIITVTTDDNFRFKCWCNGGNSKSFGKNFRSSDDLTTLGAFIKGRLEAYGIVAAGDFITEQHLEEYGRKTLGLYYYKETDNWILDFRAIDIS